MYHLCPTLPPHPDKMWEQIFFWRRKEMGEEKADLQSDTWFTFSCAPFHQQGAAHINVRNKLSFLKRKSWFYVILPFWMKTKADRRRWCEWTTCSWNFHMRKYFHLQSFSSPSFSALSKIHKPHYKHQRNKWAPFLFSLHFQFSSYFTFCSLVGRIVMQAVSKAIYWELLWKTWFQLHPTEFSFLLNGKIGREVTKTEQKMPGKTQQECYTNTNTSTITNTNTNTNTNTLQ